MSPLVLTNITMATTKQTFVYKTAPAPIQLDVYLPSSPPSDAQGLPLLVWFHGGGLLQGNRDSLAPHHLNGVTKHGYALISADYRLCPQVNVGEVLDGKQLWVAIFTSAKGEKLL